MKFKVPTIKELVTSCHNDMIAYKKEYKDLLTLIPTLDNQPTWNMTIKELSKLYDVIDPQGINEILDKHDALDKVDQAVTWFDLNFDDLDRVEFIMNVEARYNIAIDDELAQQILDMNFSDFYYRLNISKIRNDKLNDLGI